MKKTLCYVREYGLIVICAILFGFAYHLFIFPNQFAPAGIPGIATMIQYLFDFKVGYMNIIVNIPLLILTYFIVGKKYTIRSAVFAAVFSAALLLLYDVPLDRFLYQTANGTSKILAPVAAGVVCGFCYGCVMRIGGSTGGTDLVAALIHHKEAVKFEIITDQPDELAEALMKRLKHGVTEVPAIGGFTHKDKTMLICVINKHQIVEFQRVMQRFPGSFAYLSSVKETMGNFKKIKS